MCIFFVSCGVLWITWSRVCCGICLSLLRICQPRFPHTLVYVWTLVLEIGRDGCDRSKVWWIAPQVLLWEIDPSQYSRSWQKINSIRHFLNLEIDEEWRKKKRKNVPLKNRDEIVSTKNNNNNNNKIYFFFFLKKNVQFLDVSSLRWRARTDHPLDWTSTSPVRSRQWQ